MRRQFTTPRPDPAGEAMALRQSKAYRVLRPSTTKVAFMLVRRDYLVAPEVATFTDNVITIRCSRPCQF